MAAILIAYFSATGTTARVAHELAKATGGDLFPIEPEKPYTAADLNWHDKKSRTTLEMKDGACRPVIADKVPDMGKYDVIFLGFPIWWHQAPRIIETFMEQYDFSGKTIIPFATSGGSPLGDTESILKKICPSAGWKPGRLVSAMASEGELRAWREKLGV